MSKWSLEFQEDAVSDLAVLDRPIRRRIIEKLDWLLENFDSVVLSGLGAEYKGFYKLRVGDWRVVYKVNWEYSLIIVCYIDHRNKIYKKRR